MTGPIAFPLLFCSVFSLCSLHRSHEDFLTVLYTYQSCFYLMAFLFIVSSNSVNVSQITSLAGRFFLWSLDIKCQPTPLLIPSPTKFSLSFFCICIHEIYNLIYEVYYFIYSFWFLPSFSQVHKLREVKIFACFAHCFTPIAQKNTWHLGIVS